MRDALDSRLWVDHHDAFGRWVSDAAATIRSGLARLAAWDGTTHQLLALVAAFAITSLTFNATSA